MFAYQVWECMMSKPSEPSAISRLTPKRLQREVAVRQVGRRVERDRVLAWLPEAHHLDLGELSQLGHQVLDVVPEAPP